MLRVVKVDNKKKIYKKNMCSGFRHEREKNGISGRFKDRGEKKRNNQKLQEHVMKKKKNVKSNQRDGNNRVKKHRNVGDG